MAGPFARPARGGADECPGRASRSDERPPELIAITLGVSNFGHCVGLPWLIVSRHVPHGRSSEVRRCSPAVRDIDWRCDRAGPRWISPLDRLLVRGCVRAVGDAGGGRRGSPSFAVAGFPQLKDRRRRPGVMHPAGSAMRFPCKAPPIVVALPINPRCATVRVNIYFLRGRGLSGGNNREILAGGADWRVEGHSPDLAHGVDVSDGRRVLRRLRRSRLGRAILHEDLPRYPAESIE